MECVLELFCKYLEKCLWEHLFELCFSLSHGKKILSQQVLKNMLNPKHRASRSALRGCQLLRDSQKRGKSTKEFFSGKKRNGTISFKFFFWYWGKEESVRTLLGKGSSKGIQANWRNRVYKTPIFWGHVLYGWGFIKYVPQEFWSFIYPVL